jgi:hypothetical protein
MTISPRQRFLSYVRGEPGARQVISPFLPHPDVVINSLRLLGLPADENDLIHSEIRLAQALDYEPMFMTDCHGLIFPWKVDQQLSDEKWIIFSMRTRENTWMRRVSRSLGEWGDESGFPVKTEKDHQLIDEACEMIADRETEIRRYFRGWRQRVGEDGVIVIGHPHVTWMGYQVSQTNLVFHYNDYPDTFANSMEAIFDAAIFVFNIAYQEGIDFMSESTYGIEMTSPARFDKQDLPYLQRLSDWTHQHGGQFWYHNCGMTRQMILSGRFNLFKPDVLETIAPPPEGDNDLEESRRSLSPTICTKGNLDLHILRDGSPQEVSKATRQMVQSVSGYRHIHSTADAVLPGTPPENFIAFVRTAQEASQ